MSAWQTHFSYFAIFDWCLIATHLYLKIVDKPLASATAAVDLATDLLSTPKISLKSSLYSGALWKRLSVGSAHSSYTLTVQSDAPPAPAAVIDQRSLPPPASSKHMHIVIAARDTHPCRCMFVLGIFLLGHETKAPRLGPALMEVTQRQQQALLIN